MLGGSIAPRVLGVLRPLAARLATRGVCNSLAQTVLKLTSPGVPDTYQGAEGWKFDLVDPDNRQPVPFGALAMRLRDLDAERECHRFGPSAIVALARLLARRATEIARGLDPAAGPPGPSGSVAARRLPAADRRPRGECVGHGLCEDARTRRMGAGDYRLTHGAVARRLAGRAGVGDVARPPAGRQSGNGVAGPADRSGADIDTAASEQWMFLAQALQAAPVAVLVPDIG